MKLPRSISDLDTWLSAEYDPRITGLPTSIYISNDPRYPAGIIYVVDGGNGKGTRRLLSILTDKGFKVVGPPSLLTKQEIETVIAYMKRHIDIFKKVWGGDISNSQGGILLQKEK